MRSSAVAVIWCCDSTKAVYVLALKGPALPHASQCNEIVIMGARCLRFSHAHFFSLALFSKLK